MTTIEILRSRGVTVFGINTRTGKGHCFNCGWKSRQSWYALRRMDKETDNDFGS